MAAYDAGSGGTTMSVTLTTPPPLIAFSADRISALFTCTGIYDTDGVNALNRIPISTNYAVGDTITIKYAGKTIVMTAVNAPDDSGEQFLKSGNGGIIVPVDFQLQYFADNYQLRKDFDFSISGSNLVLTAKNEGTGYNITGYTYIAGSYRAIKPNYGIRFTLYCENAINTGFESIYEATLTPQISSTIVAEGIIGDKLHTHISAETRKNLPDIPDNDTLLCKKTCRRYYFEFSEGYGTVLKYRKVFKSDIFTVIHGGFSTLGQATKSIVSLLAPGTIDKDSFLKQGHTIELTRPDQPQYLYFFNTRASVNASLQIKYYFSDGSIASKKLYDITLPELRKVGFNVRYDKVFIPGDYPVKEVLKYEVWLTNPANDRISESRYYQVDYSYKQYCKYFLNWSSWGTMDSRLFYGKGSTELEIAQNQATRNVTDPKQISKGSSFIFDVSIKSKFSVATGFMRKTDLLFNRDFYLSDLKWCLSDSLLLPIAVTSKNISEFTDGNNLYAQKIDYEYLFEDDAFTEGDVIKEVSPPIFIPGKIYYGPTAAVPITGDDVLALPNNLPAETYLFPMYTGVNKVFTVALPPGKLLATVYNSTAEENVTLTFSPVNILVIDQTYKVYVMQLPINYTMSQDFIISIING